MKRSVEQARRAPPDDAGDPAPSGADLDPFTLARAQRGHADAQRALVLRYQRPVFGLLTRMLARVDDGALAEDLAQETFLRVFRGLSGFDPGGPARLSTWILTIASRLAIDRMRASGRTPTPLGDPPAPSPTPDHDVDRKRLAHAIEHAIDDLGAAYRAAFVLRELHGLSYTEIAEALQIDLGTVRSRLARARARLRTALEEIGHAR